MVHYFLVTNLYISYQFVLVFGLKLSHHVEYTTLGNLRQEVFNFQDNLDLVSKQNTWAVRVYKPVFLAHPTQSTNIQCNFVQSTKTKKSQSSYFSFACVPCGCRCLQKEGEGLGFSEAAVNRQLWRKEMGAGYQTWILGKSSKHTLNCRAIFSVSSKRFRTKY